MIETGISFGGIHSYYDLNLILSASEIPPAKPKTLYIDIPGGEGSLDLTEAIGEVKFYDRDCKFTFTMNPSDDLSDAAFEEKKTEVSNLLNGKHGKIVLDKDADYFYEGRFEVSEYLSNKRIRQIVVIAKVKPYKMKHEFSGKEIQLTKEEQLVEFVNGRKSVTPLILCSDDDTVIVFNDIQYTFNAGFHDLHDIQFVQGVNKLIVSGTGTLTIIFQEGEL